VRLPFTYSIVCPAMNGDTFEDSSLKSFIITLDEMRGI
jgi:hypothetical protein